MFGLGPTIVTIITVTQVDSGLLQRAGCSKDAQNEQEKGHGNLGAHFSERIEEATIVLWLGRVISEPGGHACFICGRGSKNRNMR
jgi:hypothetical protein